MLGAEVFWGIYRRGYLSHAARKEAPASLRLRLKAGDQGPLRAISGLRSPLRFCGPEQVPLLLPPSNCSIIPMFGTQLQTLLFLAVAPGIT